MLSERERALRTTLLDELRRSPWFSFDAGVKEALSYAEQKHLAEDLDADFISQQIQKLETRGTWLWWGMLMLGVVFLVLLVVMPLTPFFIEDPARVYLPQIAILAFGSIGMQVALTTGRRLSIYRALQALADPEPAAQPHEQLSFA